MSSVFTKTLLKTCVNTFSPFKNRMSKRLASDYKVATLKKLGEPLVIETKRASSLKKNQVRIGVKYCSVNSIDYRNFLDESRQFPFIPGYELSGEVVEIGKNVSPEQVIVGERVAALSLDKFGGFAEECVVDIDDVWRLPSNVDVKDAAVLVCGHSTALYTFSKLCEIQKDQSVVISASSAGLGLAAIDVAANAYKAKVIAVTDTEDQSELMRNRGAFSALKFTKKLHRDIMALTEGKGVSVIYDAVGEHMLNAFNESVALHGKIFHAAPVRYKTIEPPPFNTSLILVNLHTLRNHDRKLYRQMVSDVLEMADQGVLNAHISAKFELEDINAAIEYINAKKCTGKVLIKLD